MKHSVKMKLTLTVEVEVEALGPAQAALEAQAFLDAAGPHELIGAELPDEVAETVELGDVIVGPAS